MVLQCFVPFERRRLFRKAQRIVIIEQGSRRPIERRGHADAALSGYLFGPLRLAFERRYFPVEATDFLVVALQRSDFALEFQPLDSVEQLIVARIRFARLSPHGSVARCPARRLPC